jgi:hypothetical protein
MPFTPAGLQEEAAVIATWAKEAGASPGRVCTLVRCLTVGMLLAQPKPKTRYRRGTFSAVENLRFLWYRRAASLLGWKERRPIPKHIRSIIKLKVYPDTIHHGEEEGDATGSTRVCTPGFATTTDYRGHAGVGSILRRPPHAAHGCALTNATTLVYCTTADPKGAPITPQEGTPVPSKEDTRKGRYNTAGEQAGKRQKIDIPGKGAGGLH